MYILTRKGEEIVAQFIKECEAKRKEILDAGLDTADETTLPTKKDILSDLNNGCGVDEDGDYFNSWGVTDNYESDYPIGLTLGNDFMNVTLITPNYKPMNLDGYTFLKEDK